MSILGRYIFRQAAGAVLMILVSLTIVIWVAVALRQLEFMASQGQTVMLFFKLTSLALPSLIAFIAPVAMLIAMVHVLNRLNSDSELIIATAGGASIWRIAAPLVFLAIIVSLATSAVNHWVGPQASRMLRDTASQARSDLMGQALQPGRFTAIEPRLTVHIRDRANDGKLLGLLVHDARIEGQTSSYLAEVATLVRQGEAIYLLMERGQILRRTAADAPPDVVTFQRYAIDINRFEQKSDTPLALRPRDRTTQELMNPDPNDGYWRSVPQRFHGEIHDRFASAIYPFAFVLLALAYVGQAQTTRQNRTAGLIMAVAAGFGLRMLGINAATQAAVKPGAVVFLYIVPLASCLISLIVIWWNLTPRAPLFARRSTTAPAPGLAPAAAPAVSAKAGRRTKAAARGAS
jgi:lipopolysaccharide export system permease protein